MSLRTFDQSGAQLHVPYLRKYGTQNSEEVVEINTRLECWMVCAIALFSAAMLTVAGR